MIQIERTERIDRERLTSFAGAEYEAGETIVEPVSLSIWAVRAGEATLAYVGLRQQTLVSHPECWLLLCNGAEQRALSLLRVLRRLLLLARTATSLRYVWVRPQHERFTRLVGFKRDSDYRGWVRMVL